MHIGIVSFGYPPLSHVSAKRASRMAEALAAGGDRVTVITVDWRWPPPNSPMAAGDAVESAAEEGGVRVVRIDPRNRWPGFDPRRLPRTTEPTRRRNAFTRKVTTIWNMITWGPFQSWARAGLDALLQIHRTDAIDVLWAIHGDASALEMAHQFARRAAVPWVADFKDLWHQFVSPAGRRLMELATRRRLSTAAALTETCEAQAFADERQFGLPTYTIWSGYDPIVMESAEPVSPADQFVVAYFGHLSRQHDVPRLPRVIARLAAEYPQLADMLQVHVYTSDAREIQRQFLAFGQSERLAVHQYVSESRAFSLMRGADVLVLFPVVNGDKVGVKELEYIASGTPVLVLGDLLPELRSILPAQCQVYEAHADDDAVKFLVQELQAGQSSRRTAINQPFVLKYSWPDQAARLRAVLQCAAQQRQLAHNRRSPGDPDLRQ